LSYTTSVKVRFGDIDLAGVTYYPNLYHYFHIAFEDFFEHYVGTAYPRLLAEEKLCFPTVKVETQFVRPVKYGDVLEITVTVPRLGSSSADFVFSAARQGEDAPCIVSRQTVVAVGMDDFRPMHIPERYRRLFAACAA